MNEVPDRVRAAGPSFLLACAIALAAGACESGPPPIGSVEPTTNGTTLDGVVGAAISVQVRVLDLGQRPIDAVDVEFTAESGSVSPTRARTDGQGLATTNWTLGTRAGPQSILAKAGDKSAAVSATARPDVAASLVVIAGQDQTGQVAEPLPTRPIVRVADRFANGVPGVGVAFRVVAGQGTLRVGTAASDSAGNVSPEWILGSVMGAQAISLSVPGVEELRLRATAGAGPAARVALVSGAAQTGQVAQRLGDGIVVELRDRFGNLALNGRAELRGDGSASALPAAAGTDGRISIQWTLGTRAGTQRLRVVAGASDSVIVIATAAPGAPETVTTATGNAQSGWAGGGLADSLKVLVRDRYDNAVPGVSVSFAVSSGSGSMSPATAVTGLSGEASTAWRLGPSIGRQTLDARVAALARATFTATATSGPPAVLRAVLGDPITVTVGGSVEYLIRVEDSMGNPVRGVAVTTSVAGAGSSVQLVSRVTDSIGSVLFVWRFGTVAGPYVLEARSNDSPVFRFTAFANPGAPRTLERKDGSATQVAVCLQPVPIPPSVVVRDVYGNAVPGVTVTFDAGGGTVTGATPVSDQTGTAKVGSWILGTRYAIQTLRARILSVLGSEENFYANAVLPAVGPITCVLPQ
jgi:hypothetical protein